MVILIYSCGEVLIEPYELSHSLTEFTNLYKRIQSLKLENVNVIMESTSMYHKPVERFFLENNFSVYTINPLYCKSYKRNLRKTKTDKIDCISLAELFFSNSFRQYIKPDNVYLNMNALSRQYNTLNEISISLKNRYKELLYLCFPEYELLFKGTYIYSDIALKFIGKFPHADIIKNTRIDTLQNFLKSNNFAHYKKKANIIKEYAKASYPSIPCDNEFTHNLSQIAKLILTYNNEINHIKEKLINLAKDTKYYNAITSIYGIGDFTAAIIIAEIGDINRFNNIKQLTAFCGLDPSIKQSGKTINYHGPISKSGNKYVRTILYVSVLNIVRLSNIWKHDNDIRDYYTKKRNEGKHHYAATIACTTKLLRKIFALCKQLDN